MLSHTRQFPTIQAGCQKRAHRGVGGAGCLPAVAPGGRCALLAGCLQFQLVTPLGAERPTGVTFSSALADLGRKELLDLARCPLGAG